MSEKNVIEQFKESQNKRFPVMEASPHLNEYEDTSMIMKRVLLALLPAVLASLYFFGLPVLMLYIIGIATCLFCETLTFIIKAKPIHFDYSAVVTAILLVMSLPANVPLWYPVLGGAIAILVAKELFGGIGRNFLNPALTGRMVLRLLFVEEMTTNVFPNLPISTTNLDVVTSTTPLMVLKEGNPLSNSELINSILGFVAGKAGETSAFLLLLGGGYLLYKKVISWHIPVSMLGTIAVTAFIFGGEGLFSGDWHIVLGHLLGGAAIISAIFMATDYSSSPTTPIGEIIFGIGCGAITMAFRFFGSYSEGVTFAIIIMNLFVPFIDYFIIPPIFGEKKLKY